MKAPDFDPSTYLTTKRVGELFSVEWTGINNQTERMCLESFPILGGKEIEFDAWLET